MGRPDGPQLCGALLQNGNRPRRSTRSRMNRADLARIMRGAAPTRNFGRVSNVEPYKELLLPSLQETRTVVTLAPAKPVGLADLGMPLVDSTVVKKGRVHEYLQLLTDGKIGRRFQDIRVVALKTVEAEVPSAKVFVQFEVFGDNTAAPTNGVGFEAVLLAGEQQLATLSSSSLFLPYANFWYPNRFVFEVSIADFDQADRLDFIAKPEEVRAL
ncbi:hypothetical protein [Xanthobacter autotrophicus]|uniref:hypothetical protein n=1 Tax=Xanthobacter autotrophicus TaxID=280 RepID=UPI0024A6F127|nr:hypothetical protein [Xanthobacter autotrophicus]MDI4655378.1 hypothetical protein [Xanthobacter autotrophicus]